VDKKAVVDIMRAGIYC